MAANICNDAVLRHFFYPAKMNPQEAFLFFRAGQSNGLQCVSQMKIAGCSVGGCFVVRLDTLGVK